MDEIEENKHLADELAGYGKGRAEKENKLLQYMLNGHREVKIEKRNPRVLGILYDFCELDNYGRRSYLARDNNYPSKRCNWKIYCNSLAVLDALYQRGLVKRTYEIIQGDNRPRQVSSVDMYEVVLGGTTYYNYSPVWLSYHLFTGYPFQEASGEGVSIKFESATYVLTESGFEAALKLQEHNDQERRFEQQQEFSRQQMELTKQQMELTKQAIKASELSAESAKASREIAGRALWAAAAIAFFSGLNFGISVYKECCGSGKQELQQQVISKPIEKHTRLSTETK